MEPKWLEWAKQLQSIAQAGLTYSNDIYDLERFEMIRAISVEMLSLHTGASKTVIKDLFANETGYAIPKVTRARSALETFIEGFSGTIVCDGYSA